MQQQRKTKSYSFSDFWDAFWRDKDGNVVIWQFPNVPLLAWVVVTAVSIFTNSSVSNVLWNVSLGILGLWALLEVVKGVNYFRRTMGVVVILIVIAALFKVGY